MNTRSFINKQNRDRLTKGYTMAEVLMVVAILAILMAFSVVGIMAIRRSILQTEADKNAEIIFEAAERSLTDIYAFDSDMTTALGRVSADASGIAGVAKLSDGTSGVASATTSVTYQTSSDTTYFLRAIPDSTRSDMAEAVLNGQITDDLYGAGWIIEYEPTSLQVKSVFYQKKYDAANDFYTDASTVANIRRGKAERKAFAKDAGYFVGYYEGEASAYDTDNNILRCAVKINNAEELKADVAIIAAEEFRSDGFILTITTTGAKGGKVVQKVTIPGSVTLHKDMATGFYRIDLTFILDSLDRQFKDTYGNISSYSPTGSGKNLWGKGSFFAVENTKTVTGYIANLCSSWTVDTNGTEWNQNFIPGDNVTVSVKLEDKTTGKTAKKLATDTENSLYSKIKMKSSDLETQVSCGRHLQNLDLKESGLNLSDLASAYHQSLTSMSAIQTADIDFKDDNEGGWAQVYGQASGGNNIVRTFIPITNKSLSSFTGKDGDGDAHSINGFSVDVDQTDYSVTSYKSFATSGTTSSTNIKALISQKDSGQRKRTGLFSTFYGANISNLTLISPKVTGAGLNAAGTIAGATENSVDISECQSYMGPDDRAPVDNTNDLLGLISNKWLGTATYAGGLIGYAGDDVVISKSSASTVIVASKAESNPSYAGGLVGYGNAKVTAEQSYADCYISGDNVGGLFGRCDGSSTIDTCYSAGFLENPAATVSAGGLTPSVVASAHNSYSIFQLGKLSDYRNAANPNPTLCYTVGAGSADIDHLYYNTTLNNDAVALGYYKSVAELKTDGLFENGLYAFASDPVYSGSMKSAGYHLTKDMKNVSKWTYPMIVTSASKTLSHYGDWKDSVANYRVQFLYSAEAMWQKDHGFLNLPANYESYDKVNIFGSEYYAFTEDTANAIVPLQNIQELTSAYIPQQDYTVAGRERAILYWEFSADGANYYYVPSEYDTYENYYGTIYVAGETDGGGNAKTPFTSEKASVYATYKSTKGYYEDGNGRPVMNPLLSVTQDINAFAHFHLTSEIQYVRLNYRIYDGDRTAAGATAAKRYIGKVKVSKTSSGGTSYYTINTYAHSNVGGYHFYGWYNDEAGSAAQQLSSQVVDAMTQQIRITAATLQSGDIYAIYEKMSARNVSVEFCQYDGEADGWGSAICQPVNNAYTTEDESEGPTRRIYLPSKDRIQGYALHDESTNEYIARCFINNVYTPAKNKPVSYDPNKYSSLAQALNTVCDDAGNADSEGLYCGAYVEVDITEAANYVVTYMGAGNVRYIVHKKYLDTVRSDDSYDYSATGEIKETDVNGNDGTIGASIPSEKLASDKQGFSIYKFENSPIILDTTGGNVFTCTVQYKRDTIQMYYDLDGGVYTSNATKYGYHTADGVAYNSPKAGASFISEVAAGTKTLTKPGSIFDGWKYYKYNDVLSASNYSGLQEYAAANMPNEPLIAVAQWKLDANIKVRLEVYRQDRSNAMNLAAADKTYLLEKSADITEMLEALWTGDNLYTVKNYLYTSENVGTLDSYLDEIYGNKDRYSDYNNDNNAKAKAIKEIFELIEGEETAHYFDMVSDANTWAKIKPQIIDGDLVLKIYYDRKIVTTVMDYDSYKDGTNEQIAAANTDITNAINYQNDTTNNADGHISVTTYTYGGWFSPVTTTYIITMKALYGADLDPSKYVWTKEIMWHYGGYGGYGGTDKTQITSFVDENDDFYDANNGTTWNFTYRGYFSGNYTSYLYTTNLDDSLTLVDAIKTNTRSFQIVKGRYYGFKLSYVSTDGQNWVAAKDEDTFTIDSNYYFVFTRKQHNAFFSGVADAYKYKKEKISFGQPFVLSDFPLPTDTTNPVTHPNNPTKYTFGGWYTTSTFDENSKVVDYDAATQTATLVKTVTMEDHDMQFFAKWIPEDEKVTYQPNFPDGTTLTDEVIASTFTQQIPFATTILNTLPGQERDVLAMPEMTIDDNRKVYATTNTSGETEIQYSCIKDGEEEPSIYRFDRWWRKDADGNLTVKLSSTEQIYEDTEVYAKWTQTSGYADLTIHCVMADENGKVYEGADTQRIRLGQPTYVYAPLVTAAWSANGDDWTGYYPVQTRVKETFTGDSPEYTFYYTKGKGLKYTVKYVLEYTSADDGTVLQIPFYSYDVNRTVTTDVVIPASFTGYVLKGNETRINVNADYLANNGSVITFVYKPSDAEISLASKSYYGTKESIPGLDYSLDFFFSSYSDLAGYSFMPVYQIYNRDGTQAITNGWITETQLASKFLDSEGSQALNPGVYRAYGALRLMKDGESQMTIWSSGSNYIYFTIAKPDED